MEVVGCCECTWAQTAERSERGLDTTGMTLKRRITFAVSLLIASGFGGLWIRSYSGVDSIGHASSYTGNGGLPYLRFVVVGSQLGKIGFGHGYIWQGAGADLHEGWNIKHDRRTPPRQLINTPLWSFCGFTYSPLDVPSVVGIRVMEVPDWFITTISALPAAWIGFRALRRGKLQRACPACGYDLTGNVSGVCPECGMAAS